MKKLLGFSAVFLLLIIMSACSKQDAFFKNDELTRIEIQKVNENGEEVITIIDEATIEIIKNSLDHVKWNPNAVSQMARKEDWRITLFHTSNKNMRERLYKYRVWFDTENTAAIISENSTQGYGSLNKEHKDLLKKALLKYEAEKDPEEISVYKMDNKTKRITISDKDEIKTINNAIKNASKQPGIVNMADPQFKINIGDDIYYLWLTRSDGNIGTIMNFKDTHAIYTLPEGLSEELKGILLKDN